MAWHDMSEWTGTAPAEQAFLGNGVLGWRLSPNPLDDNGRLYVTGFWERVPATGVSQLAELPNPLAVSVALNGGRALAEPLTQKLDYLTATLHSKLRITDASAVADVETEHIACRNVPCLLLMRMKVTPRQSGPLSLSLAMPRPRGATHIEHESASAPGALWGPGDMRIVWRADSGGAGCAGSIVPVVDPASPQPSYSVSAAASQTLRLQWDNLDAGRGVTVYWIAALVSDLYHSRPLLQSGRMVLWGTRALGVEELSAGHERQWADVWLTRPRVEGDDETQQAVDGSMYHLHSSVHRSSRQSMAPFGLSANGYYGHVFWDCETWTFPPVLLQNPAAARSILEFRIRGLEQARNHAALFGFDGAMFPWEAMLDGGEDTPVKAATGYMEHHITPDVAYAFWQYQCATGDREFLSRGTWPVLREAARWVVSRVEPTPRGCELRHVIPADEHSFNVNNSAHTNLACVMALRAAVACAEMVGISPPPEWVDVAGKMVVPRGPDGMILQQDGWTREHAGKQADTVLAVYPLGIVDDPQDVRRIVEGHVLTDSDATCHVAMGDQINAVICARTGQADLSRTVWDRGWKPFWIRPWGMYAETVRGTPGCFVTGCGGLLQAVLMGFPGLQLDRAGFAHHPVALPRGWEAITCHRLYLQGRPHRLVAAAGMKKATLEPVD